LHEHKIRDAHICDRANQAHSVEAEEAKQQRAKAFDALVAIARNITGSAKSPRVQRSRYTQFGGRAT